MAVIRHLCDVSMCIHGYITIYVVKLSPRETTCTQF